MSFGLLLLVTTLSPHCFRALLSLMEYRLSCVPAAAPETSPVTVPSGAGSAGATKT